MKKTDCVKYYILNMRDGFMFQCNLVYEISKELFQELKDMTIPEGFTVVSYYEQLQKLDMRKLSKLQSDPNNKETIALLVKGIAALEWAVHRAAGTEGIPKAFIPIDDSNEAEMLEMVHKNAFDADNA